MSSREGDRTASPFAAVVVRSPPPPPPLQPQTVPVAGAAGSTTITHTSSQNATTFTVSSPTKKQSVISIAKKCTSPSKFFNNAAAYGVRTVNFGASGSSGGGGLNLVSDQSSGVVVVDEDGENGGRVRKCAVRLQTEAELSLSGNGGGGGGHERTKLKRLSFMDHKSNSKRFDDGSSGRKSSGESTLSGAATAAGLSSSKSFNGGSMLHKRQLTRSSSITTNNNGRRMEGKSASDIGTGGAGGVVALTVENGGRPTTLESTVAFLNELIVKNSVQQAAGAKQASSLRAKLQEELEKPLKLYAFMSLRHRINPLFLNRNLSYLKKAHKNSFPNEKSKKLAINATKKRRCQFKIDNILASKLQQRALLSRTLSQEAADEVTVSFERLVTGDDDILAFLAAADGAVESQLVMEAHVELYGLKTTSYRNLSETSCLVTLTNNAPVLLGRCPIGVNEQPAAASSIKFPLRSTVGEAHFYPFLYFRVVVVFRRTSAAEQARSPTRRGANSPGPRLNGAEQPVDGYKEFVLLCSLVDPAATADRAELPVQLRLEDARGLQLEIRQVPRRLLFGRPPPSAANRPRYGQLDCWPVFEPLALARPSLSPAGAAQLGQLHERRNGAGRKPKSAVVAAEEAEMADESEDEATDDEDAYRPRSTKSGRSSKPPPAPGGKRANKAAAAAAAKKDRLANKNMNLRGSERRNGGAGLVLSDERLEQLTRQLADRIEISVAVLCSAMSSRSKSSQLKNVESLSPTSSSSSSLKRTASHPSLGNKTRNGAASNPTSIGGGLNVYYEFYANKSAADKKHSHSSNGKKSTANGDYGAGLVNGHGGRPSLLTELSLDELPGIGRAQLKHLICPFCYLLCNHAYNLLQHMLACHPRFQIHLSLASTLGASTGGGGGGGENGHHHHHGALVHSASCSANLASWTDKNGSVSSASSSSSAATSNGRTPRKIQFEICGEDKYDGAYAGSPYDLFYSAHVGYSQSRLTPAKRIAVTYVLVHKKAGHIDLSRYSDMTPAQIQALNVRQQQQFHLRTEMQPNAAFNCQDGMERIYYHTKTCLPILADEIDVDSDNELDPDWLKEYTTILINDFDDVNRGEKDLMRLWNLHCLRSIYIAESQMCRACEEFIDANIASLVEQRLIRNFFVHLRSLYDYGLLKVNQVLKLVDYVVAKQQELLAKTRSPASTKTAPVVVSPQPSRVVQPKTEPVIVDTAAGSTTTTTTDAKTGSGSFQFSKFFKERMTSPLKLFGHPFYGSPKNSTATNGHSPSNGKK